MVTLPGCKIAHTMLPELGVGKLANQASCSPRHALLGHQTGTMRHRARTVVFGRREDTNLPPPSAPLSSRQAPRLPGEVPEEHVILQSAEHEMSELCGTLSDSENCWRAHDWLVEKWHEHECAAVDSINHKAELERLENMVRELLATPGGVRATLYPALSSLEHMDHRGRPMHSMEEQEAELQQVLQQRQRIEDIFSAVDQNHDGVIDLDEFDAALHVLGSELSSAGMQEVIQALDLHGSITLDEFAAVAQDTMDSGKAWLSSMDADAQFLRGVTHLQSRLRAR